MQQPAAIDARVHVIRIRGQASLVCGQRRRGIVGVFDVTCELIVHPRRRAESPPGGVRQLDDMQLAVTHFHGQRQKVLPRFGVALEQALAHGHAIPDSGDRKPLKGRLSGSCAAQLLQAS